MGAPGSESLVRRQINLGDRSPAGHLLSSSHTENLLLKGAEDDGLNPSAPSADDDRLHHRWRDADADSVAIEPA